jgi:hypothetical protein
MKYNEFERNKNRTFRARSLPEIEAKVRELVGPPISETVLGLVVREGKLFAPCTTGQWRLVGSGRGV